MLPAHNSVWLKPVIILSYYGMFTGVKEFYYTEYAFHNAVKCIDFAMCFLFSLAVKRLVTLSSPVDATTCFAPGLALKAVFCPHSVRCVFRMVRTTRRYINMVGARTCPHFKRNICMSGVLVGKLIKQLLSVSCILT